MPYPIKPRLLLLCLLATFAAPYPAQAVGQNPISAEAILQMIQEGQEVNIDCEGGEVEGDLNFINLIAPSETSVIINTPVRLTNCIFTGYVNAGNSDIYVNFGDQVAFSSSTFSQSAGFNNVTFAGETLFDGVRFASLASFSRARFEAGVTFYSATFAPDPIFDSAQFNGLADFLYTTFESGAFFSETQFSDLALFSYATFSGDAYFIGSSFVNEGHFATAQFSGKALFQAASFLGVGDFSGAHFASDADFAGAYFAEEARFIEARFTGKATFRDAQLNAAYFPKASFDVLDLTEATIAGPIDLTETSYGVFKVREFDFSQLSAPDADRQIDTLRRLEINFRETRQLDLANTALYQRELTERQLEEWPIQIIELVFLDWPFGYGLHPWRTVGVSALFILLFAVFYYPRGVIRQAPLAPPKPRERRLSIRLAELPLAHEGEFPDLEQTPGAPAKPHLLHRLWNAIAGSDRIQRAWGALTFSFAVFTKISMGGRVAARNKMAVVVEWILGLVMIAGFTYTLTNTVPVLQILLGAIF